jgi:hypothetical protein
MLGLLFFSFIFFSQDVHAWLSGFDFRRAINITNSGSTALTDYQVLITLDTQTLISQGKMRSDCGDIRFALADDTLLNYWIESGCNTTSTKIWVKVPSIPASSSTTIYVYYGNSSATSLSNGIAVFVFYDDFDNRTTLGNWTVTTGTWQVANGTLNETAGTISTWNKIYTPISMTTNFMIEADINVYAKVASWPFGLISWYADVSGASGIAGYDLEREFRKITPISGTSDESTNPCGLSFDYNKWYHVAVSKIGNYMNVSITTPTGQFCMLYTNWGESGTPSKFGLASYEGKTAFDNFKVRKYTYPEPTASISSTEEIVNQAPQITIYSPQNATYFYSNNFVFNFSVSDDRSSTFWIRAYLDNNLIYENTSYQNNTIVVLTQNLTQTKSYNFTIWANDTNIIFPNSSTLSVVFTIKDYQIVTISFSSKVLETTKTSFIEEIRINFDLINDISTNLIWNGTDYGTVTKTYNSTHFIFTKQITVPFIDPLNTTVNFYFSNNISYTNGTWQIVNSAINQQTVYRMYLDNCVASSAQTLQLKAYDEETKSQITPNTTQLQIMIWKESQNLNRIYSLNSSTVCIYPAWSSYNATIYAQVIKDGYAMAEHYPYTLSLLSNVTQTLSLYMLPSYLASPISFQLPQENYILTVEKNYAGTFVYIRSTKADFNKNAVIYLRPYDTFYRIYVYTPDRQLCFQSSEFKVAASTYTVTSCNQMAAIPTPSFVYEANVNLTCTYNNDTHTVYCEFYSLDDLDHNVTMYIYKYNRPFGRSLYYTQSIYGVSGSMQKQLDAGFEYDVRLEAHSDYQYFTFTVDTGTVAITEQSIFFLLLLLFIIGAIVGFIEPFAGMGIIIAGLLIAGGIGVIRRSYLAIAAFSLMIILAYALRRR